MKHHRVDDAMSGKVLGKMLKECRRILIVHKRMRMIQRHHSKGQQIQGNNGVNRVTVISPILVLNACELINAAYTIIGQYESSCF